jgi:hypothetical protein
MRRLSNLASHPSGKLNNNSTDFLVLQSNELASFRGCSTFSMNQELVNAIFAISDYKNQTYKLRRIWMTVVF